jgi:hypothetical protein
MTSVSNSSRREVITRAALVSAFASFASLLPGLSPLSYANPPSRMPRADFKRLRNGIRGPFGEVRYIDSPDGRVPNYIAARDGLGVADMANGKIKLTFGIGKDAIVCSSKSIRIDDKEIKWDRTGIAAFLDALKTKKTAAQAALLLRTAVITNTNQVIAEQIAKPKQTATRAVAAAISINSVSAGTTALLNCTTQTVTETVITTIEKTVDRIRTAEQRLEACIGGDLTRIPLCVLQGFVDIVVGTFTVLTEIAETVTREVTTCAVKWANTWPNPFDVITVNLPPGLSLAAPTKAPTAEDILKAAKLLKSIAGPISPLFECLADGKWSLTPLPMPVDFGNSNTEVPFGVKVCISANCAEKLRLSRTWSDAAGSWLSALSVLAALSPSFASFVGPAIPAATAVSVLIAAVGPVVAGIAAIMLAIALVLLYYSTMIAASLEVQKWLGAFEDGEVCIEHPSIALGVFVAAMASIPAVNLVTGPSAMNVALLVPPIVTG